MKFNYETIHLVACSALLLSVTFFAEAACGPIVDGVYVTDNNASVIGKDGNHTNVLGSLKRSDPKWAATTLGFSVALIKKSDQLIFSRTIGNGLDDQYETLSIRAESSNSTACNENGGWTLQATQYYPNYINLFGKLRGKAKKLPEPIRINFTLQPVEANALRIVACKSEVQEGGRWRAYSEYDSVDLCTNLKMRKLFNIRPDVIGRKEWNGAF
ncbi:hypothetical protein [Iodobacter ciconiae]|uniref:Uncharacterized protein n=1 Tax=Iodobacter ciconiae TaxID=2496266 RepID=A0A3S8ZPE3_9NEIS|nr:hypothetical protein [Iodobacter ciconiae]AZN35345.1 hypothetical protein EJO50_01865 [Iodobacter ciconiae]